ncbi:asparagine synthase (glutamine-hydrolysing) [Actinocorallia herbida]|uniref:asparagine synthase (glutamine-hydrolyzing) n=2 Tax=Actinocorallia herbida TaxID=58109 RepID=A0A3N1CZM1_9ACTN|nr:asparagine synthase (glutamine-hydrolysing) [Actinocorallia herbida]
MCGIGGVLTIGGGEASGANSALFEHALGHRGRSGRGSYTGGRISMHCARHAVIALAEAEQPLHDATGGFVMVGNGEVLNHRDLIPRLTPERRDRLRPGDLQVALELFAAHGPAAFEDLRGPFALAVWDRARERLTLVRDRLGERPLYYFDDGAEFVFASEVRCLEAVLRGRLTHDDTSLLTFLGLGRCTGARTMYREIKALPPGEVLRVDLRDGARARRRLSPVSGLRDGLADPPGDAEVLDLLDQACRRVLVADRPLAVGFSGGIDSTVVLKAAMDRTDVAAVITVFSAADPDEDENLRRARAVARLLGVEVTEVPFALPSFDATLDVLHTTLDQPCAEPLVLHNDALHTAAGAHAGVLLGGHGADEVFGGYARYPVLLADGGRSATRAWMAASPWERWNRAAGWPRLVAELVSPEFAAAVDLPEDALDRPVPYGSAEDTDPVLFGQALDLFRLMAYDNFRATDENGIVRGVEVRSPFFDLDLIAGAFARPVGRRVDAANPKGLLKRRFEGTPLAPAFGARKVGFDDHFPYPAWISGNLPHFSEMIAEGPLVKMGLLRDGVVPRLSELDWRSQWRLFALSAWLTR